MKYIFLDESGDLGFSDKSSRYLIITIMVCDHFEEPHISRIVKKVRQKILKKKLKNSPEIKWNNSNDEIKLHVLNSIKKRKLEIFSIVLNKSKVYDYLKKEKHKLYNYLCKLILSECSLNDNKVELIVDKSKGKRALRDDFNNYLRGELILEKCNLSIIHSDSKNNGGLQVLDFISGAIFRKYEYENDEFYKIIEEKISIKKELFASGP